jgi:two-component SAPR family response regulator
MLPLQGSRILIVEDDYLIASDLRQLVEEAGGTVLAHVSRQAEADPYIDSDLDAALLDVHLADGFVDRIAFRLLDRRIPFVVVTGYERGILPSHLRQATYIQKPISRHDLVAAVRRCIQESRLPRSNA